jgi:hypothetical protein
MKLPDAARCTGAEWPQGSNKGSMEDECRLGLKILCTDEFNNEI